MKQHRQGNGGVLFMFNGFRREVIFHFVDIGGIVDYWV